MDRSKKRLGYILIIASLVINVILLVNVFANKITRARHQKLRAYAGRPAEPSPRPEAVKAEQSEGGQEDASLYDISYEFARLYENKGSQEMDSQKKNAYYTIALLEYAKLPHNKPQYARLVREARERLLEEMIADTSLSIALGDRQQKVRQLYGQPDEEAVDKKYLPDGIISRLYYKNLGVVFGLNGDKVYEIKLCSNYNGSWHGINMGDHFDKISTLYKGEKIRLAGANYGYKVAELNTTFLFVDGDDELDGIKAFDRKFYGEWTPALS